MKTIEKVNQILKKTNISKVNLAKYLGVSRQMVYNYLEMNSISEWPKDKKTKLLLLFGFYFIVEVRPTVDGSFQIHLRLHFFVLEP